MAGALAAGQSLPRSLGVLIAEDGRITVAILHAAREVRDLNFIYLSEGKGAPVTARFGEDGITVIDPLNEGEPFRKIYEKAV